MGAFLAFAVGPVGRWLVIGLAFLAWTAYQRDQAADKARQECQAEQLQKTVDELQRQRDAAEAARKAAEEQAARTAAEMEQLENERDQIVIDLQDAAGESCRIPDSALERLRDIR